MGNVRVVLIGGPVIVFGFRRMVNADGIPVSKELPNLLEVGVVLLPCGSPCHATPPNGSGKSGVE
jgi:hypothetical protein